MLGSKNQLILLILAFCLVTGIFLFELGMYSSREQYQKQVAHFNSLQNDRLKQTNAIFNDLYTNVADKEDQIKSLMGIKDDLSGKISELNSQIAGLSIDNSSGFPFAVPTTGTVGSYASTYYVKQNSFHHGIDIWTTTEKGGAISTHKGNPVYAACSGTVESLQPDNGGVTIRCDSIPAHYNVPVHKVFTYYGHMANAISKEQYIYVKPGQRIRKGQFLGFQGDLSMFTPEMRNVHLHFSVFTGTHDAQGSQDPCKYIGGTCTESGQFFANEVR